MRKTEAGRKTEARTSTVYNLCLWIDLAKPSISSNVPVFLAPSPPMAWRELGVLQAAREAPPCAAAPGVDFGGRENLPEVLPVAAQVQD